MISIDYNLVITDLPKKETPAMALVRGHMTKFQLDVINDGKEAITKLNVRPVMESYVGQEKAQLFQWGDTEVIKNAIPPKGMESIEFMIRPYYTGIVSVALYVTDADNNPVEMKRRTDLNYTNGPIRWWFHVADDISLEILILLRQLVAGEKEKKK